METNIPEGYQQTDAGVIPDDWIAKKLGDLGKFKNGINKAKEEFGFGYPFVNLLDIFSGASLSNKSSFGLVNSTQQERSEYDLKKGDVLFVRSSVKPEGVGLTSVITEDLKDSVYSGFLIRFRDFDLLNLGYKEYCFYEEGFRKRLIDNSTVSANTNINQDALKSLVVAFPSTIEEQKAIAQALSDVDAAIAELDRLITKKRNIKQGAMQQLLTGKKRLPGFSGEWEEKRLEEIVEIDSDNLKSDTSPNYSFNYISLEDVEQGKLKNFCHCIFSCAPSRARRRVRKNDILVATVRPNLKSHFFVRFEMEDFICSTGFAVVRCNPSEICAEYIYYHFFANVIEQQLYTLLVGSNYPAVNSRDIKNLKIPLPSFDEQKAIAQILSDIDAEIEALEQKRDKYKAIKQGMMQELLTGRTRLV